MSTTPFGTTCIIRQVLTLFTVLVTATITTGCGDSDTAQQDLILAPSEPGDAAADTAGSMAIANNPDAAVLVEVDAMIPDAQVDTMVSVPKVDIVEWSDVNVSQGYSDKMTVELPEDVLSLTLIAQGQTIHFYTIEHLEGPDGQILVAENPPGVTLTANDRQVSPFPGPFRSPNRSASAGSAIGTVLAPNNPGVMVTPGTWTFAVGALGMFGRTDAIINVKALIKRGPAPQTQGVLDLHFHFTGSRGWTAANAPTDPDFLAAVERMASFYRPIGIRLGNFTYDDIDPMYRSVDAGPMGPGSAPSTIESLFALNRYDSGIALFFVDRIGTGQFGGFIGGLSGGTPGPSMLGQTSRSGVAVATEMTPNPSELGHIMGHESGHFLGLYHTQEIIGYTDMIDDTSSGRNGSDNLMFPTVTSQPARLTDGQAWVLHRSPLIVNDEVQP